MCLQVGLDGQTDYGAKDTRAPKPPTRLVRNVHHHRLERDILQFYNSKPLNHVEQLEKPRLSSDTALVLCKV